MADLDIRKLGVTLRSTSGTMAYAGEIYDETEGKYQSAVNAELRAAIGSVEVPVEGVAGSDKVLSLSGKKLSSTLSLSYEKKTGDSAKKIYLNGIGGATIASIDTTDFTKDKFVQGAELVETAETGVSVEVPYIKLTFSDTSAPVRFSVKDLVDVYTGANLNLGAAYASTAGKAPAANVSVDAAVKNIDGRVTANAADIATVAAEAANALNSVSSATTTGYVTLSVGAKADKTQAISVAVDTARSGAEIENATPTADKLVPAVALKNYAEKFATATSVTALETAVGECVTAEAVSETEYGEWDTIVTG